MAAQNIPAEQSVLPFRAIKGVRIKNVLQVNEGIGYSAFFSCGRTRYSWFSWHDGVKESRLSKHDTRVNFVVRGLDLCQKVRRVLRSLYYIKIANRRWLASAEGSLPLFLARRDEPRNWQLYKGVEGHVYTYNHRLTHRVVRLLVRAGFKVKVLGTGAFEVFQRNS